MGQNLGKGRTKGKTTEVITPLGRRLILSSKRPSVAQVGSEDSEEEGNADPDIDIERVLCAASIDPSLVPGWCWKITAVSSVRFWLCRAGEGSPSKWLLSASPSEVVPIPKLMHRCPPAIVEAFAISGSWEQLPRRGIEGWVPLTFEELFHVATQLDERKLLPQGATILDLGSGTGSALLAWAAMGHSVIGIELNRDLFAFSREIANLAQEFLDPGITVKLIHASYYPEDYIQRRKDGQTWSVSQEPVSVQKELMFLHPVSTPGMSAAVTDALSAADIWYSFAWMCQVPSVMELFMDYAKPSALLVIVNTTVVSPPGLNLIARFSSTNGLLQKGSHHRRCSCCPVGYPVGVYNKAHILMTPRL
jgi:SAM-dependent methyltransferase